MNKNIKILIVLLILIIAGFYSIKKGIFSKKIPLLKQKKEVLFPDLNIDQIDKIFIKQGEEETVLQKKEGSWQRNEATQSAQKEKVEMLLETVKEMEKEELVSQNPEKRDIYKVDNSGMQVVLKSGDQEFVNLYVGKRGPDFLSTYVRKKDSDNVWLIKKTLQSIFRPSSWEPDNIPAGSPPVSPMPVNN